MTINVLVHNIDQSLPMGYEDVDNTYVKDGFYCLFISKQNVVHKFPIARIFRVIEDYDPKEITKPPK